MRFRVHAPHKGLLEWDCLYWKYFHKHFFNIENVFWKFYQINFCYVSKNTFWMTFKGRHQSSGCLMYTFRFQLFVPSSNGLDFMTPFNYWEWGLVVFFKSFIKQTFIIVSKNTFWMASKGRHQSRGCLMYTFRFQLFIPSSNGLDFMTPFNYWEWGLVGTN